ncbi:MAG: sterol desaturase family protein [Paracoccaceae bacterium]
MHSDQPMLRRDWKNDLFYLLFNGFVVRAGFAAVAGMVMYGYHAVLGANPLPAIAALPLWVQVICVVIVSDIGYYIAHRICHSVPFLWQFHSVHHSIEEMDWLATHRVHPVDQVFSTVLSMLPVFFLGFSVQALVISQLLFHAHSLLLHSNTRINFGPLKWVLASPEYHHWHHANEKDAFDRNFAGQLSIIDTIAGTLFLPANRKPVAYGLDTPMPRLYHQQFLHPFRMLAGRWADATRLRTHSMFKSLEDLFGKVAMLAIFGYLASQQAMAARTIVFHADQIPLWGLALTAQLFGTVFMVFILYFTLVRLPPKDSAAGLMPRVIAVLGTYIMMALVLLPPDAISAEMRVISTLMIIAGTAMAIACLLQLGKSFSIMATSRELKTQGAYAIVRHPLYGAEVLMVVGVVLSHGSVLAYGVGALWITIQIRRAHYEEGVLRASFPEYAAYAACVPMLVPGVRLRWLEAPVPQPAIAPSEDGLTQA